MPSKTDALRTRIAASQAKISELDAMVAAAAADDAEDLDSLIAARTTATQRLEALNMALAAEAGKDLQAEQKAIENRARAAAKTVARLAAERADAAADIDAGVVTLVNAFLRYEGLNAEIRGAAFDAGVTNGNTRAFSTGLAGVSAVLAGALSRSGVAERLEYISVTGVQHASESAVQLTERLNARIVAAAQRAAEAAK